MKTSPLLSFLALVFLAAFVTASATTTNAFAQSFVFTSADPGTSGLGGGPFQFADTQTSLSGSMRDGSFGPGNCTCFGGDNLSLLSVFSGDQSFPGTQTGMIAGQKFPSVFFAGTVTMDAGTYKLPAKFNKRTIFLARPAILSGSLAAYSDAARTHLIQSFPLNQQGMLYLTLTPVRLVDHVQGLTRISYRVTNVRYEFPA